MAQGRVPSPTTLRVQLYTKSQNRTPLPRYNSPRIQLSEKISTLL